MATTKYTLAEQAMRILSGGHLKPDRNLDIREIMMYIDQCRDTFIIEDFTENLKNNNEYDIDSYYLTYFPNVAVTLDATTGLKTALLPASRLSLPKDMGLYSVSAPATNDNPYIPIKQGMMWQFKNSNVFNIASKIFYYPAGDRIYFTNLPIGVYTITVTGTSGSATVVCNGVSQVITLATTIEAAIDTFIAAYAPAYLAAGAVLTKGGTTNLIFTAVNQTTLFTAVPTIVNASGNLTGTVAGTGIVLVIMAVTSKNITEDDLYPVPPDKEKTLVDMAIERFGVAKQIPHDEIEDGNK